MITRRHFLHTSTSTAFLGLGSLGLFKHLGNVSAEESRLPVGSVQFRSEIEPIVRLLEETSRDEVIGKVANEIQHGLSYRDVLAALLLAGVRNIQPRPVGFKFHAVLVVNSAHQASMNSPDSDRWLPIFWAIDNFKTSQARDVSEGDWTLRAVGIQNIPEADQCKARFESAMDRWDVEAADLATAGVCRGLGMDRIFDLFCRYGARDFRDIGHKIIYVANSWRTLQVIGWRHAEPVLRSLAYALLMHEEGNPSERDSSRDRDGRRNWESANALRQGWSRGRLDAGATGEFLALLRSADSADSSRFVVERLNEGIDPQSLWDALFQFAGELLMKNPGIVSLHAVTTLNALHYSFQTCSEDRLRGYLLLQAASFLPLFRGRALERSERRIDTLDQQDSKAEITLDTIFDSLEGDRDQACRRVFQYLQAGHSPQQFMDEARRYIFLKGSNSHDYKFSSAALEDYYHLSPPFRNRFLASSVFNLKGRTAKDNPLIERVRQALPLG